MKGEAISILLIEDNFDHAEIIKRCFESHRIENKITHLSDGEQAVNFLFRQKSFAEKEYTLPNLILLDLRLPKIDGLEVLTKVKQEESLKSIPVVILTSSENENDINSAYKNYVNSYMVKPLDFEKFNRLMQELGFYWLGWNKPPQLS